MSNGAFSFSIVATDGRARLGRLTTPHGSVDTPAFVPVGTQATVKAVRPADLREVGVPMVMCNTYHLYLRPGSEIITKIGGLHQFMGWDGPLMTDSGGFQVLSLGAGIEHGVGKTVDLFARLPAPEREDVGRADDSKVEAMVRHRTSRQMAVRQKLCVVTDERIIFKSHLDGTLHEWTPEKSVLVQQALGADIIFALDECTSPLHSREYTEVSMLRSHQWEERSLSAQGKNKKQAMYGIIQGGPYEDLRRESARFVDAHEFFGVGVGGALVDKSMMRMILEWVGATVSGYKPVHLLGIGTIDDIFAGVERGVDSFDCSDPTRIARRGDILLLPADGGRLRNQWRLNVTAASCRSDRQPLGSYCGCPVCKQGFRRAYVCHLLWSAEVTGHTLATIHNLWVMERLMEEIRDGIADKKLNEVKEQWLG